MPGRTRGNAIYLWYMAAAIIVIAALVYLVRPSPSPAQITSLSTSVSANVNISANAIAPGPYPQGSCPAPVYQLSSSISGHKGLSQYNVSGLVDYVLPLSANGTISYTVHLGPSLPGTNGTEHNLFSNWAELSHLSASNTVLNTHPGINISITPQNDTVPFNSSYNVSVDVVVLPSAYLGTYLVSLSPGPCHGGQIFLLTVGNVPYNGTVSGQPAPS